MVEKNESLTLLMQLYIQHRYTHYPFTVISESVLGIIYKEKSLQTLIGASFVTCNTIFLHMQLPIRFSYMQKYI